MYYSCESLNQKLSFWPTRIITVTIYACKYTTILTLVVSRARKVLSFNFEHFLIGKGKNFFCYNKIDQLMQSLQRDYYFRVAIRFFPPALSPTVGRVRF